MSAALAEALSIARTAEEFSRIRRAGDPRIARRAACLSKHGAPNRARRLLTCAPIELGGYPCHDRALCPQCRSIWTWEVAESWKYAVVDAVKENPDALLYKLTLTCGTFEDWLTGVTFLKSTLTAAARWVGSWALIDGLLYLIEIVRRGSNRYYVHLHGVVALDRQHMPAHPRQIARRWAKGVVLRRVAWGLDREPRDFVAAVDRVSHHVSIEPLAPYRTSGYLMTSGPLPSADVVGSAAAGFAQYVADETKELEDAEDKVSFAYPLRIEDEVEIALGRVRLHGATGTLAAPRNGDNSA